MKARILGIAILLVFGVVRMPIEARLEREQRALHYHGATFTLDTRQRLGQMGFVAALSGFRALVADVLWIQAHTAWQRTEWGRMKREGKQRLVWEPWIVKRSQRQERGLLRIRPGKKIKGHKRYILVDALG